MSTMSRSQEFADKFEALCKEYNVFLDLDDVDRGHGYKAAFYTAAPDGRMDNPNAAVLLVDFGDFESMPRAVDILHKKKS